MFARSRPAPFAVSLLTHGAILAWVVSGPVREKPANLYRQTIAPHESKLVWYNFQQKLPDVSPTVPQRGSKPLTAEVKLPKQEIHAGSPASPRGKQFIWQPAPKVELRTELKSPNVLAIHVPDPPPAPPKPKLFVPPPEQPKVAEAKPLLPDAPQLAADRNLAAAPKLLGAQPAKAPPRAFVAPHSKAAAKPKPLLPDAPEIHADASLRAASNLPGMQPAKAPPRKFVAPREAVAAKSTPILPDAPVIHAAAAAAASAISGVTDRAALKAPPGPPPAPPSSAAVSMAIVGLAPAAAAPAPTPEGSRDAHLSAGPEVHAKGGSEGSVEGALLTVPGLLIRNADPAAEAKPAIAARAAPTSRMNLAAAVHNTPQPTVIAGDHPAAVRVSSAPDPQWGARDTYAMSVQMPNVTSYTGSWMIWFSEHSPQSGGGVLNPPVPIHKVDPKYYPAAMADRVEGKVRLAAVIRKDGRVDSVRLIERLDARLDQSAQEALDQWRFEPALRNGEPVDVDAVIEIPFRLAPKIPR